MLTDGSLTGRTALVTGGAAGIGRACAVRLARAGAAVTVLDRDETAAKEVASLVGGRAIGVDLADLEALEALTPSLPADILVNNAGIQHVAPIEDFPPEVFATIVRLMLEVPFRLARICLPRMYAAGWGRVVNVSSVHGVRASPYKSAYVAAKHGLEGLSKVIAMEGASRGVTSNCVNPAYVRTALVEQQISAQAQRHGIAEADVVRDIMLAPAAIKRLIEPDEVADLVGYLCSAQASFVTGTSIMMDGGWSAH
jgi:3-hydroxybutyrate dehydrogenase